MEQRSDRLQKLLELIENTESDSVLSDLLSDYHKADIAEIYPELSEGAKKRLARLLPVDELSDVVSYLDNPEDYIEKIDNARAADIIEKMDADDAVDVLDELSEDTRSEIMNLMQPEAVEDINLIQSYDEDAVGSRMTTNFILIRNDMPVKQAMRSMIDQAAENDNVSTIYVEDKNEEYCGAINLRDLIVARADTPLEDIIIASYPSVFASESIASCIEHLKDYGEDSIPVLDDKKRVIGVITSVDLVEASEEEFSDDYAKFAALTEDEDVKEPLHRSIRKRLPWLILLFFLGLGVSSVIGMFESVIASLAYIVSFQSLVLGMAGNVGTQSLAVTIRVLSDEEPTGKEILRMLWKEMRVGLINGLVLGLLSFLLIGAYLCIPGMGPDTVSAAFLTSGCIGVAFLVAMTCSATFGMLIPILFKKIKIDPAVASGPLITTINDLVAAIVYYGLAWLLILNLAM